MESEGYNVYWFVVACVLRYEVSTYRRSNKSSKSKSKSRSENGNGSGNANKSRNKNRLTQCNALIALQINFRKQGFH